MALFDVLLREVSTRFNLGDKASSLLNALLALINDPQTGGFLGFLSRFNQQGLGDLVTSWTTGVTNKPLSPAQLERSLGQDTISRIAGQVGLPQATTSSALAYLVPEVVHRLTPDNYVPNAPPTSVTAPLTGATATTASRSSLWTILIPLLLLGILAFFGLRSCGPQPTQQVAVPPTPAVPPVATISPKLSLKNIAGKLDYSGLVADDKTKQSIVDQLKANFGAGNINGDITVNPAVKPAGWLAQLGSFLSQFKLPGAELFFEGDKINLGGAISDADKQGLLDKLKSIFGPQFTIGWLPSASGIDLDALAKAASEKARAALSQLKPGFGAQDLISALNLTIINFATSSAQVLATDKDLIKRAADAIKAAPAGLKLEIGGHTDSTGDTAANLQLSQARAEAVRDELIQLGVSPQVLIAKGYGGTKPIASNETEAGRFQNRRIEYTIVK